MGTPNATEICERCHFPRGWLEDRSGPTNVSPMTGADSDGAQCDFRRHRKGQGGTTPGSYTATVTGISATGYHWDGVTTAASFAIQ